VACLFLQQQHSEIVTLNPENGGHGILVMFGIDGKTVHLAFPFHYKICLYYFNIKK
jgi:hypothetical protein